jgi:hypothetical protein
VPIKPMPSGFISVSSRAARGFLEYLDHFDKGPIHKHFCAIPEWNCSKAFNYRGLKTISRAV